MLGIGLDDAIGDAARLLRELADALAYAHAQGVVHRDLKPENVLLSNGHALVADFGVAKALAAAGRGDSAEGAKPRPSPVRPLTTMTAAGMVVGTPAYMAPEQLAGVSDLGPACDVYALGVILYELLTGRLPFEAPLPALFVQVFAEAPEPPSKHRPGVDPQLDAACLRALAKAPESRFASMADFAQALAGLPLQENQAAGPATLAAPAPASPWYRRPSGRLAALVQTLRQHFQASGWKRQMVG